MRRSISLVVMLAASAGTTGPAVAHAFLRTASPGVGSTVQTAPGEVAVTFTEGVEPRFSTIMVTDAHGARVDTGGVHLAQGADTRLIAPLRKLAPGAYTVVWHATSTDTHKTRGSFTFTVAP